MPEYVRHENNAIIKVDSYVKGVGIIYDGGKRSVFKFLKPAAEAEYLTYINKK